MAKRLHASNFLTIASVAVLVGIELVGAAIAAGWAIGGLFDLGKTVTYATMALCCGLGLWATVAFVRNAIKVEPIYR